MRKWMNEWMNVCFVFGTYNVNANSFLIKIRLKILIQNTRFEPKLALAEMSYYNNLITKIGLWLYKREATLS